MSVGPSIPLTDFHSVGLSGLSRGVCQPWDVKCFLKAMTNTIAIGPTAFRFRFQMCIFPKCIFCGCIFVSEFKLKVDFCEVCRADYLIYFGKYLRIPLQRQANWIFWAGKVFSDFLWWQILLFIFFTFFAFFLSQFFFGDKYLYLFTCFNSLQYCCCLVIKHKLTEARKL